MTYQEILDNTKPELEKNLADYKAEILKLRTGRLSPALIEDIMANCFGSLLPLKQLGAISAISSREIVLQLWDKTYVEGAACAIEQENLGLSMRIDGNNIYLISPTLTEDVRKNLIVVLNKTKEDYFQGIRHIRDKAWRILQDKTQTGEIREDDKFRGRDKLDEMVKDFKEKMDQATALKEKEIIG